MLIANSWWRTTISIVDSILYRLVRLAALFLVFPIFAFVDEAFTKLHASKIMVLFGVRLIVFSARAWFYVRPYNLTSVNEGNYSTYSRVIFLIDLTLLFTAANLILVYSGVEANILFGFGVVFFTFCFYKRPSVRKLLFFKR